MQEIKTLFDHRLLLKFYWRVPHISSPSEQSWKIYAPKYNFTPSIERERERERQTETDRDRQRQRERDRDRDRETERQRQRQRGGHVAATCISLCGCCQWCVYMHYPSLVLYQLMSYQSFWNILGDFWNSTWIYDKSNWHLRNLNGWIDEGEIHK